MTWSKVNAYVIWPDISTPFSIGDGPSCTPTSVCNVSVSPQFCSGGHCWTLEIRGSLFKISSLTAIFSFQTENIQVTLPLEDKLEGKVEFKTYANYFTVGVHWSVIIFLILVNIAAQVRKGVYFDLCTQVDIYILFILYFMIIFVYSEIYFKELAHEIVGSSLVSVKSERQACRLEPQAGADPAVLRQNFFLPQEASGFALRASA